MVELERNAIVIGASTGIGAACVRELIARGYRGVAAIARNGEALSTLRRETQPDRILTYIHDVTHRDEIPHLFEQIRNELGDIHLVVYNAGIMPRIDEDTYDTDKDMQVMEVNTLGCMAWLNCVAPYFKSRGQGSIIGISSIAGDRGRRGYPAYNTSKAAMDTFLEALRNRLSRHGVTVTTIKPGYIDTDMTKGLDGMFWLCSPDKAAAMIVSAGEKGKTTRYVPRRWGAVGFVIRNIPSFIFRRMDI